MKRISLSYWIILFSLMVFLASCGQNNLDDLTQNQFLNDSNTQLTANVVYGTDGRLDFYQVTDERLKVLADSTVALIKTTDLNSAGLITNILGTNFGLQMNLCASEKFREQDTAAFCSGSLVGPDTVITAGHCIQTLSDCQETSLVFGFAIKSVGVLPKSVNSHEVYKCKEIIKTQMVNTGADFAIIKLDRPVTGHAVLNIRPSGEVDQSAALVVIGHPVGLPTKITTGGTIRSLANPDFISANLDTYGGNSGSAVFNLQTGLIEGILVRGEQDFVSLGSCAVSKVCAEGTCRGEDVTRISAVRPFLAIGPSQPNNPASTEKFISTDQVVIPDNNTQGILSLLQVGSIPNGRKVFVNVNIKHPKISDLVVKLLAADGTSVVLQQRAGSRTRNLIKSYEVTSSLGKVATAGRYKLIVQDVASKNVGTLLGWSIEFK